ncbi:Uncharacterised protein [uncultured archaeon]|nr:Uncharacterised protein [uncultured archaeon]
MSAPRAFTPEQLKQINNLKFLATQVRQRKGLSSSTAIFFDRMERAYRYCGIELNVPSSDITGPGIHMLADVFPNSNSNSAMGFVYYPAKTPLTPARQAYGLTEGGSYVEITTGVNGALPKELAAFFEAISLHYALNQASITSSMDSQVRFRDSKMNLGRLDRKFMKHVLGETRAASEQAKENLDKRWLSAIEQIEAGHHPLLGIAPEIWALGLRGEDIEKGAGAMLNALIEYGLIEAPKAVEEKKIIIEISPIIKTASVSASTGAEPSASSKDRSVAVKPALVVLPEKPPSLPIENSGSSESKNSSQKPKPFDEIQRVRDNGKNGAEKKVATQPVRQPTGIPVLDAFADYVGPLKDLQGNYTKLSAREIKKMNFENTNLFEAIKEHYSIFDWPHQILPLLLHESRLAPDIEDAKAISKKAIEYIKLALIQRSDQMGSLLYGKD